MREPKMDSGRNKTGYKAARHKPGESPALRKLGGGDRQPGIAIPLAQSAYFLRSLLCASFTAVSRASAAFTFTSGSTPVPSQSVFA
jgi:hypothetical protein